MTLNSRLAACLLVIVTEAKADQRVHYHYYRYAIGLALFAFLLRAWLIDFPTDCHPDERIIGALTKRAVDQGGLSANWDGFGHAWWTRPTYQFSPYTLIQSVIGKVVHWSSGWPSNLDDYILLGRICSCLWGAGAVFLVFLIGRTCFSARAGLWGEMVMAICFVNIQDSIYARVDAFLCFFVLLSVLLAVRAVNRPGEWKWLGAAAFSTGFTVAAKYNALPILALVPCVIFCLAKVKAISWKWVPLVVLASLLLAVAGFVVATPELLWRPGPFFDGLAFERNHYRTGHIPHQAHDWTDNNLFYWLSYLAELGFGYLPLVFCICFFLRLIRQRRPEELILAVYLLASLGALFATRVRFERNLELSIGVLATISGVMALSFFEWIRQKPAASSRMISIIFVALWLVQPSLTLARFRETLDYPCQLESAIAKIPNWRSKTLLVDPINREPNPDVFAYRQLFVIDYGDQFSEEAVKRWRKFIGFPPATELRSPWSWYGYPFSTVDTYHGPFRVYVFRMP